MEQLTVFYRILHGDLAPNLPSWTKNKNEYREFIVKHAEFPGYPLVEDVASLPDHLLRFQYYKILLFKVVNDVQAELHQTVFIQCQKEEEMKIEVTKIQRYIDMNLSTIKRSFLPVDEHHRTTYFSDEKGAIDLHDFLEVSFRYYLNEHIIVPCKKRKLFIEEQRPSAQRALAAVKNYDVSPKLKDHVAGTIERFLSDGFTGFTFAQMNYCAKLNQVLNQFFDQKKPQTEEDFIFLLLQLNFNRNGLLQYVMEFIKAQLDKKETRTGQLTVLCYYQKRINGVQHPASFAYNEKIQSLKAQLLEWLTYEFQSISLQEIEVRDPIEVPPTKPIHLEQKHKINLSVPESALLLRILKNSGIIDAPKEGLFDYFSTHFYTAQAPNISAGSLRKKYDYPNEKNMRTVRAALERCLKQLDEIAIKQFE